MFPWAYTGDSLWCVSGNGAFVGLGYPCGVDWILGHLALDVGIIIERYHSSGLTNANDAP